MDRLGEMIDQQQLHQHMAPRCDDTIDQLLDQSRQLIGAGNRSAVQDPQTELPDTLCRAVRLWQFASAATSTAATVQIVAAVFGLLACPLALIVLNDRKFGGVSFAYHRIINAMAMPYLLSLLMSSTVELVDTSDDRWFRRKTQPFAVAIHQAFQDFAESLVVWIFVERALCCFCNCFVRINRRPVARAAVAMALGSAVAVSIPTMFVTEYRLDNVTGVYRLMPTDFARSESFRAYSRVVDALFLCRVSILMSGSFAVAVVLIKYTVRKRRLIAAATSSMSDAPQASIKLNKTLCILQICEAIPLAVAAAVSLAFRSTTDRFGLIDFISVPRPDALELINGHYRAVICVMVRNVVNSLVNCGRFYLYVIFAKSFRNITLESLVRIGRCCCATFKPTPSNSSPVKDRQRSADVA